MRDGTWAELRRREGQDPHRAARRAGARGRRDLLPRRPPRLHTALHDVGRLGAWRSDVPVRRRRARRRRPVRPVRSARWSPSSRSAAGRRSRRSWPTTSRRRVAAGATVVVVRRRRARSRRWRRDRPASLLVDTLGGADLRRSVRAGSGPGGRAVVDRLRRRQRRGARPVQLAARRRRPAAGQHDPARAGGPGAAARARGDARRGRPRPRLRDLRHGRPRPGDRAAASTVGCAVAPWSGRRRQHRGRRSGHRPGPRRAACGGAAPARRLGAPSV